MKHKILLGGGTNVGKTMSLIQLALTFPDKQVEIYDMEGEVLNVMEEMALELPNLKVTEVTPDWEAMNAAYQITKTTLGAGDWLGIDMLGVLWDLAQNYFSKAVYGETPAMHILKLKEQSRRADFGGFDGLTEWPVIKRMHNDDFVDDAVRWRPFNVMATTSMADFPPKAKMPTTGPESLLAKEFGRRLEGEKHNIFRFRTVAVLYHKPESNKFCYKLIKDKGTVPNLPLPEVDFTGKSFVDSYLRSR